MRRGLPLVAAALALACASEPPPAPEPAQPAVSATAELSVDIWSGFARVPVTVLPHVPRVVLVLDVTDSMRASAPGGPPRYAAAAEEAVRLVETLPGGTDLRVDVLGLRRRGRCGGATTVAGGAVRRLRPGLAARLREVKPAGEGSLAGTLDALAHEGLGDTRVVAISDLGDECGGDLCTAAAAVVAAGGRLEVVVLGDAAEPACLADLSPPGEPRAAAAAAPEPPAFRVQAHYVGSPRRGPTLARGTADGRPVRVPAGPVLVVVELNPPAYVGPMELAEGTRTRIRMLDFPTLRPPVREWRWDVERTASELADEPDTPESQEAAPAPAAGEEP